MPFRQTFDPRVFIQFLEAPWQLYNRASETRLRGVGLVTKILLRARICAMRIIAAYGVLVS
jgi:hypothetical protein